MPDINIPSNKLLTAYLIKKVSAHFKVNRKDDSVLQVICQLLDKEAEALESQAINQIKTC